MTEFDSPWKEVLDRYFAWFLAFFFPRAYADIDWARGYDTLDKALQKIVPKAKQGVRVVDKLVKVWLKNGEETWLLIHVEIQVGQEKGFGRRLFVYNVRIFARYDHEVETLVILADDNPTWRPRSYRYGRWYSQTGLTTEPVKLLDYANQVEALERDPNPFALIVLAHLKALETRDQPDARRGWKVRVIKGLYERGLKAEDVRELFRIIDWLMNLPEALEESFWQEVEQYQEEKHMPYITSVERIGMKKGLLKGIEVSLTVKFGAAGLELLPEIRQLEDHAKLEAVLEAIETAASPEELRQVWAPKRSTRKRS